MLITACSLNNEELTQPDNSNKTILDILALDYKQLPEQEIARSFDNRVYAQYTQPSEKYTHGILGDKIEAEQLVVVTDSVFYSITLANEYVFEDIRPRLHDVDGDGALEFICIKTHKQEGAGIAIYKIVNERLVEYAHLSEIGTAYRWLNIVTINDLDNDGTVELAWIETPHIGGVLKVAKILAGELQVIDETRAYSNHAIGERNLCLSVLTQQLNKKVFYVPNQSRNKIIGFSFENNKLNIFEEITQDIDFAESLEEQYNFSNIVANEDNCIFVK